MKTAILGKNLSCSISIVPAVVLLSTLSVCAVYGEENRITKAVNAIDLEAPRYQPRDIDGDGKEDTMCNWYVADVATKLGYGKSAIPVTDQSDPDFPKRFKARSANKLNEYFRAESKKTNGNWKAATATEAAAAVNRGEFVVASKTNPRGHGHIAVVIPGSTGEKVRVAQAGRKNGKDMSVKEGFGTTADYFAYKGK